MRVTEKIAEGKRLGRGRWGQVDPRTRVVPAKRGKHVPYQRQSRRKADRPEES